MDQEHLTQTALARRWQVSRRTLERWRWIGRGPDYLKVGGQVRYRLEDIEAFEAKELRLREAKQSAETGSGAAHMASSSRQDQRK